MTNKQTPLTNTEPAGISSPPVRSLKRTRFVGDGVQLSFAIHGNDITIDAIFYNDVRVPLTELRGISDGRFVFRFVPLQDSEILVEYSGTATGFSAGHRPLPFEETGGTKTSQFFGPYYNQVGELVPKESADYPYAFEGVPSVVDLLQLRNEAASVIKDGTGLHWSTVAQDVGADIILHLLEVIVKQQKQIDKLNERVFMTDEQARLEDALF